MLKLKDTRYILEIVEDKTIFLNPLDIVVIFFFFISDKSLNSIARGNIF